MGQDSEEKRKVALVTGSTRGIGAAIVSRLAKEGYDVAINYPTEAFMEEAAVFVSQIEGQYGVTAKSYQANVASFDETKEMINSIKDDFGSLEVLVNNAGITRDGLIARMSEADFDDVINVNLKGTFNCIRHAVPIMMRQRYGRIVSLSSVVGLYGNPGQVNYAASKAGIIGITKSAAKELAKRNITVNAVAPGFIQTHMTEVLTDKQKQAVLNQIAAGYFGTVDDVAATVNFLVSEESRYVTGQVIAIDGGLSI
ncbi:MAG: 3-oxoacyl-[acyl-carrier-protein] reductase [Eggerthellaceae bacterium]|nr:3-oxoacyl-[acyl-carrier-protein] reductase [Eggerthellaceae bacterium]